jgi:RNase P protein component
MKLFRLRGRKTCERVMKRGEVWRGKHMKITYLAATPTSEKWKMENGKLFVGTIASTKTEKSAVKRNRMRTRTGRRVLARRRKGRARLAQ